MRRVSRTSLTAKRVGLALATVLLSSVSTTLARASESKQFGIAKFAMEPINNTVLRPSGEGIEVVNEPYKSPFTQAGGHPWALATDIELTSEEVYAPGTRDYIPVPTRDPKDIVASLPPGLLGDPLATPRCSLTQVTTGNHRCPADTQVGEYLLKQSGNNELMMPIVNVTPEKGQSAEFALENTTPVVIPLLTAHLVHTSAGYSFTVSSNEIPEVGITHAELTFWGVPADPSHDPMRGLFCRNQGNEPLKCQGGGESAGVAPVPFLTMGTDCSAGAETATLRADSWQEPGSINEGRYSGYAEKSWTMAAATGCNLLRFDPSIEVQPDTQLADEPVGLGVNLRVPLAETPSSLATPQLRDTVLTMPTGMSVSPGVVDGIQACNEFGPEGINITGPESEEVGANGELQLAAGHCPDASIVGTAEAITPFLPVPVKGHVYLARPGCGAAGQSACTEEDALDGNLYRLYLELGGTGELAQTGIHFKVALQTQANPATGQLTTRALGTPQAPFSELKVHLNGGPRAPIANPATCGPALTTADLTPWSAPGVTPEGLFVSGTPDAAPSSFFNVDGCSGAIPGFSPGFAAGMVRSQAGAFSAFTLNLSRGDREQYVKGIQVHTPPGLLGVLANVSLCGEPAANEGTCSEAAKIGTTRVASGAGSHPFEIGGNVYLTGPYRGAPFGLSIVTDAVAGPFNLGLVVVRARIDIDPQTSALTVTTDETGPHAIPQIIFGVPLRLQRVTVDIDRPSFMFNPTNCVAQQISATVSGDRDAIAQVQSPFAVGDCKSLPFKPAFSVSTSGHTSRASGASLDAKVSYPAGSLGNEANIARVKVELPKQLPSRLTTLQKACTAATFAANPAACPAGSVVGIVKASTPLLPVGLEGPVYFVSHGGEAFPSLIIVLQGDGVRVDLTGSTFISKTGITSSTFKTVPDVPVDTFELYLPEGKYSALAANGNLCASRKALIMPTELVAQNGAVIHQSTKIAVSGCRNAATAKRKPKKKTSESDRRTTRGLHAQRTISGRGRSSR